MEISGIGGYRDRSGLGPARASVTGASSSAAEPRLLEKPPTARSVGAAFAGGRSGGRGGLGGRGGEARSASASGSRLLAGGHRASEPILLDFDLPAPAATGTHQHRRKGDGSTGSSAGSSATPTPRPKRKSMPRLDNLTPTVHVTDAQKEELKTAAEDRIARTMLKSQAAWDGTSGIFDDPKQWKLHSSKPHLSVYRRRDGPGSDQSISTYRPFVATGRIPGITLQDIEYGLYAETTPDERALNAYWFGDFFLDAAVLETYETQTDDDRFQFFGMKWLLTGAPSKIISPRDNAFMMYSKTVTSELGEKVLVKVVESVPEDIIPFIPDQGELHFVRSELSIIYMYHYDAKTKEVQVFCEGKIDPAGRTPSFMANINLTLFAPIIVQLDHIADAKFITKHGLMFPHRAGSPNGEDESVALSVSTHIASPIAASTRTESMSSHLTASWIPDSQRKACFVCFKSFSLLRRHRHHCRMCGEVMCARCTIALPLVAPPTFDADKDANFPLQNQPPKKRLEDSNRHGFPVVNMFKFCKKCMFAVRQERRAMVAGVGNYYFTEGMIRHYAQMQAAFAGHYQQHQRHFLGGNDDDDGCSGVPDDDETIVDEVSYSRRIEKLRQEHMAREKQKLRDQRRPSPALNARVSIRLFDETDVSGVSESSSSSRKQSVASSDVSFDFDNLVVTDPKAMLALKSKSDSERLRASHVDDDIEPTLLARSANAATKATGAAHLSASFTKTSTSGGDNDSSGLQQSALLPIDIRRRSFSIPEHFEKMERSIAEQEALLSSIQHERAKIKATRGEHHRLPIGAVMRSMTLSNATKHVTSDNQTDNQTEDVDDDDDAPSSHRLTAATSISTGSPP